MMHYDSSLQNTRGLQAAPVKPAGEQVLSPGADARLGKKEENQ